VKLQREGHEELKVFISQRDSTCGEYGEHLGAKAWITLAGEKGACVWRAPTWIICCFFLPGTWR
jgi:hypothetical protein